MNDQQRAAMQMALEALETLIGLPETEDWLVTLRESVAKSKPAITALREALNTRSSSTHSDAEYSEVVKPQCNQHPDAPHGFDRNASHNADRYVCECESWIPEHEATQDEIIRMAQEAGLPEAWITVSGVLKWSDLERFAALVAEAKDEEIASLNQRLFEIKCSYRIKQIAAARYVLD